MANKPISEMGLPKSIGNIFVARNILTAKDALSLTEFELMELLDVGLAEVTFAVAHISQVACPRHQTALSLLEHRSQNEHLAGHLPTLLKGLDAALCGGIPFGVLTELVGPAGIGKTQLCLKLSLLASLPSSYGGLGGRVIYIDVESKFSSRRLVEIGFNSFPEIFRTEGMAQEMAGRILVMRPTTLSEFTERCELEVNSMPLAYEWIESDLNKLSVQREWSAVARQEFTKSISIFTDFKKWSKSPTEISLLCLKLSLLASLPSSYGGLGGRVIYIDVESKFSSRRLVEIGFNSFPEIFRTEGMAQEMAGRILVMRPTTLSEFTESLQQIKVSLLQHQVKLLIIDSMAALVSGEYEQGPPRQNSLGWHISFIKSLAEFSRIPVVVTNQVRSQSLDEASQYSFQVQSRCNTEENFTRFDSHLVAALGIHWAHSVTIRLVLEAKSGKRFMKVAKSPMAPPLAFPFIITSSGISLLNDDGVEMTGPQINTIHCQGLLIICLLILGKIGSSFYVGNEISSSGYIL
ncbi:unnamed protein product [Ilex paraguariensis]|uniref:RecA family profile 1 domain-containing protein n=1 Tax=Ilex paraguariensis TaxID=185542 RepID=A0ABC8TL91_9AQUA